MTSDSERRNITEAVTHVAAETFGNHAAFCCLTGSVAAGTARPDSDIDILIALDPALPLTTACDLREQFTNQYVKLHRRFRREADLQWPGEVCYLSDIDDAINGGAFQLNKPDLPIGPIEVSYRYWLSMTATGTAVAGRRQFHDYAHRCATAIARHTIFKAQLDASPHGETGNGRYAPYLTEWRIALDGPSAGTIRSCLASETDNYREHGRHGLTGWKAQLREPAAPPPLDRHAQHWSSLASDVLR